jgi:transcriptional regulator with XRE-family HTH domain
VRQLDWNLFSSELKNQMDKTEIKSRKLNLKINRSNSYISQILNGKIKKVDYETSRKIFEVLNLINVDLLDYYLYLLGVELPNNISDNVKVSNMIKRNMTLNQCYKDAWGYNPKILDNDLKPTVSPNSEVLLISLSKEVLEKLNRLSEDEFRTMEQQATKIISDYVKFNI